MNKQNKIDLIWWAVIISMMAITILITSGCSHWSLNSKKKMYEIQQNKEYKEKQIRDYRYKKTLKEV